MCYLQLPKVATHPLQPRHHRLRTDTHDKSLSVVGERPLVRALGHTVAALEAVGAEHRVLNPQVRRAVGRVREQALFRLIFLLHTPVPLPQARRPDSCQTVWSSTTGWRLSNVRVAQTQTSPRQPVILSSLLAVGGGVGLLLLERNDYTQKAASDRTTLKHGCQLGPGDWAETYSHSRAVGCVSRVLRPCGTR